MLIKSILPTKLCHLPFIQQQYKIISFVVLLQQLGLVYELTFIKWKYLEMDCTLKFGCHGQWSSSESHDLPVMQLVTNWNDTNYSDSLSASLEAGCGQGSNGLLFMKLCLKWLLHSEGNGEEAVTPLDATTYCGEECCGVSKTIRPARLPLFSTSKALPCRSACASWQPCWTWFMGSR